MAWARIVENFHECAKKTLQSTVIRLVLFWGLCYVHHLQIAFCFMSCIDCCIHSTFANSNSWAPETLPIQFNAEPAEPKGVDLTEQHVDWMNRKGDLNNKPMATITCQHWTSADSCNLTVPEPEGSNSGHGRGSGYFCFLACWFVSL